MNKRFLSNLRSQSCYPFFRSFIWLVTALGYLLAIAFALGAALSMKPGHLGYLAYGLAGAIVIGIVVAILRELSLMIADIADAAITMAGREREEETDIALPMENYMDKNSIAALAEQRRDAR